MNRASLLIAALTVTLATGCTGTPPAPAPDPSSATPDPSAVVDSLLARPLTAPTLAAGEPCPTSPTVEHSPVVQPADARGLGNAPIYPIAFYAGTGAVPLPTETDATEGLYWLKVVWASSDDYEGPVLVRIVRVDGPGRAVIRLSYSKAASRGDGVLFDVTRTPSDWPSGTYVSGPGCYAYQIDGVGFTEHVYLTIR